MRAGQRIAVTADISVLADDVASGMPMRSSIRRSIGTAPWRSAMRASPRSLSLPLVSAKRAPHDRNGMADPHLKAIRPVTPSAPGCEDCLMIGSVWVHLRLCLTCGHVGCCDSSPNRHARKHFHASAHPIIQSFEPGEDWRWCYVHEAFV